MTDYQNLKIIGFDETPFLECGRSRALYLDPRTETCFFSRDSGGAELDQELTAKELKESVLDQKITLTTQAIRCPGFKDAVALWAKPVFLKELGIFPEKFLAQSGSKDALTLWAKPDSLDVHWVPFKAEADSDPLWLCYVSKDMSETVMEDWAKKLQYKGKESLDKFYVSQSPNDLELAAKVIDFALLAAVTKHAKQSLRWLQAVISYEQGKPLIALHRLIAGPPKSGRLSLDDFTRQVKEMAHAYRAEATGVPATSAHVDEVDRSDRNLGIDPER